MLPTVPVLVSAEAGVSLMVLSKALFDTLVTMIEYVWVVVPSWAVTTVEMVVWPTAIAIAPDADPEATVTLFTFIVALASALVAVTVTDAVALPTDVV